MDHRKILKNLNLSLTSHRVELLNALEGCEQAITEKELEVLMKGACNRTTIYRNLNFLVQKKIVHRILSGEAVKYKLAFETEETVNKPDHLHFECTACNTTFCFEDIYVQDFSLPEGFTRKENQFIILGTCNNCRDDAE